MYGTSECTISATHHTVTSIDLQLQSIPIGRPLPGYICQVLDEYLQPVLPQQIGELFIGGQGVFQGYLHRPDLTQEVLVKLNDGHIYYRTGDLVQMSGSPPVLYYIGRKDFQVKLRGQRIECGEIEQTLLNFPTASISQCVVIKWDQFGDDHLLAYVQSKHTNGTVLAKELRTYCKEHLPECAIPSLFIVLERFPINANGKVDRKALPPPNFASLIEQNAEDTRWLPSNKIEKRLQRIWCEILKIDIISSTTTSFFSLGGNSLQFMRLYHHYRYHFSIPSQKLPFSSLLTNPTISAHAQILQSLGSYMLNT